MFEKNSFTCRGKKDSFRLQETENQEIWKKNLKS